MQAAHNHGAGAEWFERLPVERKRGVQRTFGGGDPIAGRHAVRHEAADKTRLGSGGSLGQSRRGWDHHVQERERERRAGAAQDSSAGQVFFR